MRMIILGLLLGIAIIMFAVTGRTQSTEVWLEDGSRYTRIDISSEGTKLCEDAGENQVRCMNLPPGSVLLLPIPESAPVDSL